MSNNKSAVHPNEFIQVKPEQPQKRTKVLDLSLSKHKISVTSLNRKNKETKYYKPIEDYHLADEEKNIFILMDGATRFIREGGSYPDPSPAAIAAKTISHSIYNYISENEHSNDDCKELLSKAVKNANAIIKELNNSYFKDIDFLENDYANACGIAAIIKNGIFHYSFLGDPQGYLIRNGNITPFTVTQTAQIDSLYLSTENEKKDLIEFRKYVCGSVRNKKDHAYSFGSLTGEESALDLLEHGKIELKPGDRIILTSDGVLPLFHKTPSIYLEKQYEALFDKMELLEAAENIRSDDKTLIAIDIA